MVKASTVRSIEGEGIAMDDDTTSSVASERSRTGQPVANPRRLRLGRDGRPLPQQPREDAARASA